LDFQTALILTESYNFLLFFKIINPQKPKKNEGVPNVQHIVQNPHFIGFFVSAPRSVTLWADNALKSVSPFPVKL
jgi:hypothetical protein